MKGREMIVDDDKAMCEMLEDDLKRRNFQVTWHTTAESAFADLKEADFDVVLADIHLPGMTGIELCERICSNRPDIPVIAITGFGNLETAVASIRAGAYDFVTKPIDTDLLEMALDRAVSHRALQEKVKVLSRTPARPQQFGSLLGESPSMQKLFSQMSHVADTDISILLLGESGTGKELVAQTLHRKSKRGQKPFVAVNCSALPETLLESELFGHKKGAYTDATTDRKGLFQEAQGGTLFLDEVGEMPLMLQPKLLRALEAHAIRPVGGNSEIAIDVRIIAATNQDIERAVEAGRFREDLFYRLNVMQIEVPPLRSRGTDILLLADHFVKQYAQRFNKRITGISDNAAQRLMDYVWHGNVRELRNAMERAVALTRFEKIAVDDLPKKIQAYQSQHFFIGCDDPYELLPMEDVERRYIHHVLKMVGGNRTAAARILKLDRKTLYRKLQRYGADKE
ncbi:MAG: sigma-54 dependent transcriptional regulator [Deltaproteobacteria bacterium]